METAAIEIHDSVMELLVDAPPGDGPHPAVLLMFHRGGLDDFTKGRLAALREAGGYPLMEGFLTPEALFMVGKELEAMVEAEAAIEMADAAGA